MNNKSINIKRVQLENLLAVHAERKAADSNMGDTIEIELVESTTKTDSADKVRFYVRSKQDTMVRTFLGTN